MHKHKISTIHHTYSKNNCSNNNNNKTTETVLWIPDKWWKSKQFIEIYASIPNWQFGGCIRFWLHAQNETPSPQFVVYILNTENLPHTHKYTNIQNECRHWCMHIEWISVVWLYEYNAEHRRTKKREDNKNKSQFETVFLFII